MDIENGCRALLLCQAYERCGSKEKRWILYFIHYRRQYTNKNYAIATYHISLPKEVDVLKKAAALAVGQTIGTWIPIPGITEEIREKYMGKVVNVFDVPSLDLATQITGDQREYLIQIAYPAVNFGTDLPLLITALLGNDASTSAQVKLFRY